MFSSLLYIRSSTPLFLVKCYNSARFIRIFVFCYKDWKFFRENHMQTDQKVSNQIKIFSMFKNEFLSYGNI